MNGSAAAIETTRGHVGRRTYEATRALIKEGKKATEAFSIVAEQTGRSAATVATAYYRVARSLPGGGGVKQRARGGGVPARPERARPRSSEPTAPASAGATTADLLGELTEAAAALAKHVERLERENAQYRTISAALDRLSRK